MIIDTLTEFADAVALNTGAAATYLIGSQIDSGDIRDLGQGQPIYAVFIVNTTATSGGSATASFSIASDSTAAVSTTTSTIHVTTPVFAVADMVAGTVLAVIALPAEGNVYEQFLGLLQTTGTAAFTAGAVDVFLTMDNHGWKAYADGQR